jgi:CheY-like chemotaxis protein
MNDANDIVVVDDNHVLVSVLSEIFKELGYTVRTASDGFEALATIRERVPGILISDLNMPRMTGYELLSIVRRRFPTVAVIAMSGAYRGNDIPPGIAADGFYAKGGSSVAQLLEILNSIADESTRRSKRTVAPIWIPGMPTDQSDRSTTAVSCPECLRTFFHYLRNVELLHEERYCPHCRHPVQLAIVRASTDLDKTGLQRSANASRMGDAAYPR